VIRWKGINKGKGSKDSFEFAGILCLTKRDVHVAQCRSVIQTRRVQKRLHLFTCHVDVISVVCTYMSLKRQEAASSRLPE
jgi:hypothetical protein